MAIASILAIAIVFAVTEAGVLGILGTAALTDLALMLASAVATLACLFAAQSLAGRERKAWIVVASANFIWFGGHAIWTYYQIVLRSVPVFPHWMQAFFVLHPLIASVGLLHLPTPLGQKGLTPRHIGNLVLIGCTVAVSFVVTLWEPASMPARSAAANAVALLTASALAAMCMTALYLLWSYRWDRNYWPLLFVACGAAVQTVTYVTNIHFRMASTYSSYGWYNVSWLAGFAAIGCAAYERSWRQRYRSVGSAEDFALRERWLEAGVPALLIVVMLIVVWLNTTWLTTRVAALTTAFAAVFAVVLSVRDAWIQREEQRLLTALNRSNDGLVTANRELLESESRYRTLNAELEQRVAHRTIELQAAYRELEGFSYAVAHDIKAPLRAINSFASLLLQEYAARLDSQALNYVERMRSGALHVAHLVDDLLAYAHVERLELRLQATDLNLLIDACVVEQRDEILKLKAEVAVDAQPLIASVDRAAMLQALRNLVQNALKFSGNSQPPRVTIKAWRDTGKLRVSVADNGIGFDMQYHDRIFALFQRLHRPDQYAGTGIGLAIARKAVERMGGRMWADSKPNEGATFNIELPVNS